MKKLFALLALCAIYAPQTTQAKFQELKSMKEYEKLLKSKEPVVLQFSATWCPACNNIKDLVSQVAQEQEFEDITIARLDTDKFKDLAKKYDIQSIPAMVALDKKGQVLQSAVIGGIDAAGLRRQIRAPYKK